MDERAIRSGLSPRMRFAGRHDSFDSAVAPFTNRIPPGGGRFEIGWMLFSRIHQSGPLLFFDQMENLESTGTGSDRFCARRPFIRRSTCPSSPISLSPVAFQPNRHAQPQGDNNVQRELRQRPMVSLPSRDAVRRRGGEASDFWGRRCSKNPTNSRLRITPLVLNLSVSPLRLLSCFRAWSCVWDSQLEAGQDRLSLRPASRPSDRPLAV
jgi:hypothetical protein